MPATLKFDIIYTTSVLEHVDCPLCELRKLQDRLHPQTGVLIVGLKNDGFDLNQNFERKQNDRNHHIYTWNALLLANMLESAGYKPCNSVGQVEAWHEPIDVAVYHRNKHADCKKGLEVGKAQNVQNLWAIAVPKEASCHNYHSLLNEFLNCKYLENS
eukprot:7041419-Ditylum_brightwellii.AAC.1